MTVTQRQFDLIRQIYTLLMFSLLVATMVGIGIVLKHPIEMTFAMVAFLLLKRQYSKEQQLHATSMITCFVITLLLFVIIVRITLPIHVSLLCPFVLGLALAYGLSLLAGQQSTIKNLQHQLLDTQQSSIEEQLRQQAIAFGLKGDKVDLYVDIYGTSLTRQQLSAKYGYTEQTIANLKTTYNKLRNN